MKPITVTFSPHPWGWTLVEGTLPTAIPVFPTPVGMDLGPNGAKSGRLEFSPHPWGWTVRARAPGRAAPVFPTPVGMDRITRPYGKFLKRFPHTRGDGPQIAN